MSLTTLSRNGSKKFVALEGNLVVFYDMTPAQHNEPVVVSDTYLSMRTLLPLQSFWYDCGI